MVGEARRHRRQARRPRLRLAPAAAAGAAALALACAYAGDPPGGPPDTTPPRVVRVVPESGAVLTSMPSRAEIDFDEVVNEQVAAAQRDIQSAVLLSPVAGKVTVDWRRTRLTIEPKGGFKPGRIYRLELLPVITDLRQNRIKQGKLVVFSTGPAIPSAALRGTVVDWTANHAGVAALVEAVLLPDSLPYRTLADSAGNFSMLAMPAGDYLVYGVVDQNGNRRREPREAFDTARVALRDTATVALFAFTHDTVGPRLKTTDIVDSLTVRLVFDRPLDPTQAPDTSMVHLTPAEDTTLLLPISRVLTPASYDSLTKAAAAARDTAARRPAPGGAAPAGRDTTQRRPSPAGAAAPAAPPRGPGRPGQPPLGSRTPARTDSTIAMHLLARRPPPTDNRIVRLPAPLQPGSRYVLFFSGWRGLTGVVGHGRAALFVPRPPPRPAGKADSLRAAQRPDTSRAAPPRDTLRVAPPTDTLQPPARPDSTRPHRDSTPPATRGAAQPALADSLRPNVSRAGRRP